MMGFEQCTVELPEASQGQKVKAVLKVKVTYCVGLEESVTGKKTARQQVAANVLKLLDVDVKDSTKTVEQLHSHCGKMGLKQASYYSFEDSSNVQHYWAFVAVESLKDVKTEIHTVGNESENESESIDSAAEAMINVLEGVKLKELVQLCPDVKPKTIVSSSSNPQQSGPSAPSSSTPKLSPQKSVTAENGQSQN